MEEKNKKEKWELIAEIVGYICFTIIIVTIIVCCG